MSSEKKLEKDMWALRRQLLGFARSLCRDPDQAEDLVQVTYLKAIRSLISFEVGTNLKGWLFTILRNTYLSENRKNKYSAPWSETYENDQRFSTGMFGINQTDSKNELELLLKYMSCLPVQQCDALIAISYLGMSYEMAAECLGEAIGTIKSRVNRARIQLVELFETDYKIVSVSLNRLQTATRNVPMSHPFYPIAQAYEKLYGTIQDKTEQNQAVSEQEKAWQKLVASGALDDLDIDVPSFIS